MNKKEVFIWEVLPITLIIAIITISAVSLWIYNNKYGTAFVGKAYSINEAAELVKENLEEFEKAVQIVKSHNEAEYERSIFGVKESAETSLSYADKKQLNRFMVECDISNIYVSVTDRNRQLDHVGFCLERPSENSASSIYCFLSDSTDEERANYISGHGDTYIHITGDWYCYGFSS